MQSKFEFGSLLKQDARKLAAIKNPCIKSYGAGPVDKRCKDCKYLFCRSFANNYYKCEKRGKATAGPGTDHRVNWPSCAKFEERIRYATKPV